MFVPPNFFFYPVLPEIFMHMLLKKMTTLNHTSAGSRITISIQGNSSILITSENILNALFQITIKETAFIIKLSDT